MHVALNSILHKTCEKELLYMVVINARCSRCGLIFPFKEVSEGSLRDSVISNNLVSCPRPGCGAMAKVNNVSFNSEGKVHGLIRSTFNALTDPRVSRTDLEQLLNVVNRLKQQETTPLEAFNAVKQISPAYTSCRQARGNG